MNVAKIVTTISAEIANTTAKVVSTPTKTTPKIDGLNGLNALASQNMSLVQKSASIRISDEFLDAIKSRLQRMFKHQKVELTLNNEEIKFIALNFMDLKAENVLLGFNEVVPAFWKFNELDKITRQKILNSNGIKILFDAINEKASRYSCFDLPNNIIDEIDELIENDFLKYYFKTFFVEQNNSCYYNINSILPDFLKRVSALKSGFCCAKESSKFYDLLKSRNCDDIDELANILIANIRDLDEKELDEIYFVFKRLLDAKTADGKFIFGTSKVSDTTSKNMLSGIENILNLRKTNQEDYKQYLKLLELTEQGKVPSSILGILAKESKINEEFIEVLNKYINGKSSILKFSDLKTAQAQSKLGDTLQIGEKLFYKTRDELIELQLSKPAFEKLFPEIETMAISQGKLGDCYLISAIYDFIKNPNARGKIYQMFSQDGDDIIVTIPDAKEFPIRFSRAILNKQKENVNASLGIQLLESAYSETRALKYGTANKMTAIAGGLQLNVYNALLGKHIANLYYADDFCIGRVDLEKLIKVIGEHIEKNKKDVKGITELGDTVFERLANVEEQELLAFIAGLEAKQRSLFERKNILSNVYDNISADELLQKLINTPLDENLVSIGAKNDVDIAYKDKLICGRHAYSVLKVDKDNKTIDIVNPWNTATHSTITFDQFKCLFNALNIANLS